jgi:glycolate oxidase FAD binding subunit
MSQFSSTSVQSPSASIVDYPARDMTVTVGAGMAFGDLQRILREENQQLPIDVADDKITLGKMVAEDVSGPRQFGYGTLRDYVIGIEAAAGDGRVFHAGGRVVKNVAGYDLCRLLVGSKGQLGAITQLTFKLKPLPIQQVLLAAGFRSLQALESALERLNLTATTPVIMDVVSRNAGNRLLQSSMPEHANTMRCSDAVAQLVVGFEGPDVACQWQAAMLKDELLGTAEWVHAASSADATSLYCRAAQIAASPHESDKWMAKIVTLPSRVASAMTVLQNAGCDIFGRAGNGVLFVRSSNDSLNEIQPAGDLEGMSLLQSLVADGVGSMEVLKSVSSRSPQSLPQVQEISRKLKELLG